MTILLVTVVLAAGCQTAKKPEPAPKNQTEKQTNAATTLLGAAEKDPYTNGCVSCHKKEGDVDRSLPAYVQKISGHPEVKETTVNACYVCHDSKKNFGLYKQFLRGLHKVHWGSETFYGKQNGQCYSCHTVETNGVSGIKNYPPAGYREEVSKSNGAGPSNVKAKETPADKKGTQETEKNGSANQPNEQNKTPGGTNNNTTDEVPTPTP
jgi:cytochrome c553